MLPKTDAFACGAAGLKDCGPDGKDLCEPLSVPEARTHFGAVWAPAAAAAAAAIGSVAGQWRQWALTVLLGKRR